MSGDIEGGEGKFREDRKTLKASLGQWCGTGTGAQGGGGVPTCRDFQDLARQRHGQPNACWQ